MHEKWSGEKRERAKGRKVKFARLLGAALNTGIINEVERTALAKHCLCLEKLAKKMDRSRVTVR